MVEKLLTKALLIVLVLEALNSVLGPMPNLYAHVLWFIIMYNK